MRRTRPIITLTLAMSIWALALPARAGIPVIDAGNLIQNIMTALENVARTAKQIQQYQTQLQQYEQELKNSVAPSSYIWPQASKTIDELQTAMSALQYYQNSLGSLNAYLSQFHDVKYYQTSPCFTSSGCSASELAAIQQNRALASESQKKANDALFQSLDQQQQSLKSESARLQQLQANAQGASGQMQALGYANQFAGEQVNQLMEIRGMLLAQQQAVAARQAAALNRQAQQEAADKASEQSRYVPTTNPKHW